MNKLLKGNTLDLLKKIPDNSVDIGVTSPPYNKQEKNNGGLVQKVIYSHFKDALNEQEYQANQILVLNELYRIIKPGGSFFYNHKTRWEKGNMYHPMDWLRKTNWVIRQEIIWDRTIAANIRGWRFWQVDERIYWLYKPIKNNKIGKELKSKHALMTSIWKFPPERNNSHPAPFPLLLPLRCILSVLDEEKDKVVIDPYAGSGTTLLAAQLLGHNYIGIDISETYIADAKKRIKNYKDTSILEEEISKHMVKKTFKERKARGEYKKKK